MRAAAAEATLANVREQLIDQKERTKRAEEAAQLANEAQRAQAAEVDEAEAASLARLRAVLGLTDAESTSVYQAAAGPLFRKAVQKAVRLFARPD